MYLSRAIEYAVQNGRARSVPLKWLFPLIGIRASKSGINYRIFSVVAVNAALVLVAMRPAIAVLGIRLTRALGHVIATSQPAVFSRAKAGHECREGCHRFQLFLAKVPGVADVVLKSC